jgi:3-methylcrotonyl-CoA carboxylase beta subunit
MGRDKLVPPLDFHQLGRYGSLPYQLDSLRPTVNRLFLVNRSAQPPAETLRDRCSQILQQEARLREGGGKAGLERQRKLGRLPARDRIALLLDSPGDFFEIGLWAAYGMYQEWGNIAAAGAVAGIGDVAGVPCMIIANDASVKAGAFFPQTVKKLLRAQRIAFECSLPILYLVDSAGVFLPMQDEIFPDEDDFGRIFRNNSVISAAGIPQFAAIMGNCVAGGAYLPVLCDKILMTEGSGLYLAGPSLVKAAIGQIVDQEELGGARMHAEISGTVDFYEKNDESCLKRLRSLVSLLPEAGPKAQTSDNQLPKPAGDSDSIYGMISLDSHKLYDMRDLLGTVIDKKSADEYKADYGKTLVTAYARIGGRAVGIVANQRLQVRTKKEGIQMGGVIYSDSADKAARFIMDCNQTGLPIIFFQDVTGFMVGKDAEQSGIIRSGAKLVNAVSNSVVPKITVVVGGSFGAGNYALCGKAYDPRFIIAWPNARYAVMGAAQASDTVFSVLKKARERDKKASHEELEELRLKVKANYEEQTDIRYGAARGWVDAIIQPHHTREVLTRLLKYVTRPTPEAHFHTGVIQV